MINRTYIVCDTCEQEITARVVIGGNPHPIYTFRCPKCSEEIQLGLNIDYEKITFSYEYLSNCRRGDKEGVVVNLSAEIAINKNKSHEDFYFPTLFVDRELYGTHKTKVPVIPNLIKNWKNLKRAWSLSMNGKDRVATRFLNQYVYLFDEEFDPDLNSQIFNFTLFFLAPKKYEYVLSVFKLMKEAQDINLESYKEYIHYYGGRYESELMKRFYDIYQDYMKNFDVFFPIMMYIKAEKDIDPQLESPSFSFNDIKMFYGNTFELVADSFVILACLNNLLNKRKYDEFKEMDLDKYLSIDKANRANPFKENRNLSVFSEEFDNSIRNASHHGNISLSPSKDSIILKSGKPLKEKTIALLDYLIVCNKIFITVVSLNAFSIFIVEQEKTYSKE